MSRIQEQIEEAINETDELNPGTGQVGDEQEIDDAELEDQEEVEDGDSEEDEGHYEEEEVDDPPHGKPVDSQPQIDALNNQMAQISQGLNYLIQQGQQRPQRTSNMPQFSVPPVDLDEMTTKEVVAYTLQQAKGQWSGQIAQERNAYQKTIEALGGRFMEVVESVANDPSSFGQVKETLSMLQRSPGMTYADAFNSVSAKSLGKQNKNLNKQVNSDRKRRKKLGRKVSQAPKGTQTATKKTTYTDVTSAVEAAASELGFDL